MNQKVFLNSTQNGFYYNTDNYEYTIIPKACEFFHGIVLFYLTHLWVEP